MALVVFCTNAVATPLLLTKRFAAFVTPAFPIEILPVKETRPLLLNVAIGSGAELIVSL